MFPGLSKLCIVVRTTYAQQRKPRSIPRLTTYTSQCETFVSEIGIQHCSIQSLLVTRFSDAAPSVDRENGFYVAFLENWKECCDTLHQHEA